MGLTPSQMPILRPIPIPTKGKPWYGRLWAWLSVTRQWEVMEDYAFDWKGITLLILKGFIFDGASIPRIFWAVLSPTGLLLIPGLFHDHGYRFDFLWQLLPDGTLIKFHNGAGRSFWDRLFHDMGEVVNGVHFANSVAWGALKVGGWMAWAKHRNHEYPSDKLPPMDERGETPSG